LYNFPIFYEEKNASGEVEALPDANITEALGFWLAIHFAYNMCF